MEIEYTEPIISVAVLERISSEFKWPEAYSFEDDLPDGIVMNFPKSSLYFTEDPYGEIDLKFLFEETDVQGPLYGGLSLVDALTVLVPNYRTSSNSFSYLNLKNDTSIYASLEKVENGIRDICILVLKYLIPHIQGDFSWVKKYMETYSGPRM